MPAGRRLLVVEDEPPILEALLRLLRQAGFEASGARTGLEALARLDEAPPSLVVLDVLLPDLDGLELCRRIRQRAEYTPVLMLTARRGLEEKLVGLGVGADAYLPKPFEPRELVAEIRALLRLVDGRSAAAAAVPPAAVARLHDTHRRQAGGAVRPWMTASRTRVPSKATHSSEATRRSRAARSTPASTHPSTWMTTPFRSTTSPVVMRSTAWGSAGRPST